MDDLKGEYERELQDRRRCTRLRPGMYLGNTNTVQRMPLYSILRLVWYYRIFRHPKHVTIHLSPTQYVVIVESGPLIRPLQKLLTCEDKYVLTEGWDESVENYVSQYRSERSKSAERYIRPQGWRCAWEGPTRLCFHSMLHFIPYSYQFLFGVRFDTDFWCQLLADGRPVCQPTPLVLPAATIGLVTAAHLDAQWFTGLPFGTREVQTLASIDHVTVEWHGEDDLLPDGSLSMEYISALLQG